MQTEFLIRPNEQRPGWPVRKDFPDKAKFDAAVEAMQKTVGYYGHPYDDVLDWREMVLHVISKNTVESRQQDGTLARTLCWNCPGTLDQVRSGKRVVATPRFSYAPWREDALGLVRYVFVTFDVREDHPAVGIP